MPRHRCADGGGVRVSPGPIDAGDRLNPRKAVSQAHIESLADSIERFGLMDNLAGLMIEDGQVGIVAGGCRLRAIQYPPLHDGSGQTCREGRRGLGQRRERRSRGHDPGR